jgi:hypothetical protein
MIASHLLVLRLNLSDSLSSNESWQRTTILRLNPTHYTPKGMRSFILRGSSLLEPSHALINRMSALFYSTRSINLKIPIANSAVYDLSGQGHNTGGIS